MGGMGGIHVRTKENHHTVAVLFHSLSISLSQKKTSASLIGSQESIQCFQVRALFDQDESYSKKE